MSPKTTQTTHNHAANTAPVPRGFNGPQTAPATPHPKTIDLTQPKIHLCPSARCVPGSRLFGIKAPNGQVLNLQSAMPIDANFASNAEKLGPPEHRMRFAATCIGASCTEWDGKGCSAIKKLISQKINNDSTPRHILPSCPIRRDCQWNAQSSSSACMACETFLGTCKTPKTT